MEINPPSRDEIILGFIMALVIYVIWTRPRIDWVSFLILSATIIGIGVALVKINKALLGEDVSLPNVHYAAWATRFARGTAIFALVLLGSLLVSYAILLSESGNVFVVFMAISLFCIGLGTVVASVRATLEYLFRRDVGEH